MGGGPEKGRWGGRQAKISLGAFPTDAASQLDVLGHDGHALGMDRAKVGVLEKADQVRLRGLLERHHRGGLEPEVRLEVLSDLADEALEGQLPDEELGGFLVAPDLTERHGPGTVPMRLLHATGGGRALSGGLRGQLLSRGLASGTLASGLLRASHVSVEI